MSNKLGWIAFGGIAIGAICFGVAMAVGGRSVLNHLDDFDIGDWDNPRCGVTPAGSDGTRELAWSGGDRVAINVPANVHWSHGQGDKVTVTGDAAILPLLEVEDNQIRFNCHMRRFGKRLDVTLPGRDFQRFTINGSADMHLDGIDQTSLKIRINGSGEVTASGKTGELDYSVAGSGDGHFEDLVAERVSVNVAGSGDADVSPHQRLDVNIAGSGKVTLHSEPQQLETHIAGSGRIIHTDGSVTRKNGMSMGSDNNNRNNSDSNRDWDAPAPPRPPEPPQPPRN